jgi:hypothetical protein
MLRLDDETSQRLETFTRAFRPAAEVIRHLIGQAIMEDFPQHWRLAVREQKQEDAQPRDQARTGACGPSEDCLSQQIIDVYMPTIRGRSGA